MTDSQSPKKRLISGILLRLIAGIGSILALLLPACGYVSFTGRHVVLLGTLVVLMLPLCYYLLKRDPKMLARMVEN
jgi:hypothetical protein